MTKKIDGWYNGFNIDVDIYMFLGSCCFRVWRDNAYDVKLYSQPTLGM